LVNVAVIGGGLAGLDALLGKLSLAESDEE